MTIEITISIPDSMGQPLLEAFQIVYPIPVDENGDPVEAPFPWARSKTRDFFRSVYRQAKAITAAEAARQAAVDAADSESDGIVVS